LVLSNAKRRHRRLRRRRGKFVSVSKVTRQGKWLTKHERYEFRSGKTVLDRSRVYYTQFTEMLFV
jgi:hypothetical protein